jgi:hypothetical protein
VHDLIKPRPGRLGVDHTQGGDRTLLPGVFQYLLLQKLGRVVMPRPGSGGHELPQK